MIRKCPHCGLVPKPEKLWYRGEQMWAVRCRKVGCIGSIRPTLSLFEEDDKDKAICAWNLMAENENTIS